MTQNTDTVNNTSTVNKGVAGRINYAQWDKVANDLVQQTEQEEQQETQQQAQQLGLDGKYARSAAEAEERQKLQQAQQTKKQLEQYQQREQAVLMKLPGLLGDVNVDKSKDASTLNDTGKQPATTVRITRKDLDAGTRVLSILDTSGQSMDDTIVVTHDLSLLESQISNPHAAKSFADDAENAAAPPKPQTIHGLVKLFVTNVHHCTLLVKCKLISGVVELHHCSHVKVIIMGPHATVATVQMDLSHDMQLEFHDAPSGKNHSSSQSQSSEPQLYWGHDADDRVFTAGVSHLKVRVLRDEMVEHETTVDYLQDGATAVGAATAEEQQFVTSVVNGQLQTEAVVNSKGRVRAMTSRELQQEKSQRQQAATMAVQMAESMIQIKDKHGNPLASKTNTTTNTDAPEQVLSPAVQTIVDECLDHKQKGNEAFGAGEYGQAILHYTLALDKAEELPKDDNDDDDSNSSTNASLFATDVVYSNRAACFLKLGHHEKAEQDAASALVVNPANVKALFRQGLALHALGDYDRARPSLARALQMEPKNAQIQQALKFCEVRLEQEHRKRMQG